MKMRFKMVFFIFLLLGINVKSETVSSPDGNIVVTISTNDLGNAQYSVKYKTSQVISASGLGFRFKDFTLKNNLKIVSTSTATVDENWERIWGNTKTVRNNYNQLTVNLQETTTNKRLLNVIFRVFNDGMAFRYEIPQQANISNNIEIMDEYTEFQLPSDNKCWWSPGDWEIYEHLFTESKVSEIECSKYLNGGELCSTYIPDMKSANTPFTMKTDGGLYVSIHEADLVNYGSMVLHVTDGLKLTSTIVPWPDGSRVKTTLPMQSPWRTIQISPNAGGLIESNMIENLNPPCKLASTDWIKPDKYIGVWWAMHVGIWSQGPDANVPHGATTAHAKHYIDFASKKGIKYMLVEGWNSGHGASPVEFDFDFNKPYPDFDINEVIRYGKEKNVELVGQNETCAAIEWYDSQLDTAFSYAQRHGIHVIKTGYVGNVLPTRYYHHSQWAISHYRRAIEKAAQYQISIISHEVIKATGETRTYPNWLSRETLRGQEWEAWGNPYNPPSHTTVFPFTTMLGGSIDYTPGIFNIKLNGYNRPNDQAPTTLVKQLALYLTINSPMPMVADIVDNYEPYSDAFKFIQDVPTNWQNTKVLNAEIGQYLTIVRKDRNSNNWFLGSITNENSRDITVKLDFLDAGKQYTAEIYADGSDAHWKNNPTSYKISTQTVNSTTTLTLKLAAGGGQVIAFKELGTSAIDEKKKKKK